jgi:HPt (histidine-containing phosphotransfer) domain-containing protein
MKPTVDLTFIRGLMGNDERVVEKFISIFKSQIPRQLQELKLHYVSQDSASLSIVAHSIKSQLNYIGTTALADQISTIETMVDEGNTDDLGQRIHSFDHDMNLFLEALQ